MNDTRKGGDLDTVSEEQAPVEVEQDREYDNLDDAAAALKDMEEGPDEEEPTEPEEPEETEADEDEAEEETDDGDEEESEAGDAVVTLPDGETMTVSELMELRGNGLRQADYTAKTTELAQQRKALEAERGQYAERLQFAETAMQNLAGYLEGLIPPEPSLQLAQSDPSSYQYQRALRESAIGELQKLVQMKGGIDQHKGQASEADQHRYREAEQAKLVKAMPHLSDPLKRTAFDQAVKETAIEFGFSEQEAAGVADARVLQLVHYARLGKRAEHNRNNAKKRVETPKQGKAKPAQQTASDQRNREAMRRLSKTGSYEDALKVDFA